MKERAMFHLKVQVFENGNLIRDFSTPRRLSDVMWAEKYFRYLKFLAIKWYPIFKRWCVAEDVLPEENIGSTATWFIYYLFIYHCNPVWMKRELSPEEVLAIYEMCRAQYYLDNPNNTTEVTAHYEMTKEILK